MLLFGVAGSGCGVDIGLGRPSEYDCIEDRGDGDMEEFMLKSDRELSN